ncbi:serine hydrolase [Alcaligenes faecalis]|uniref:serine hydrolase n=1 Tax=Alcaligenes faecalis TaxID=511 RepID=UPI0005A94683|nr:serine hydrolase [Alcaligenes faecalis]ATI01191.1 serine hydrolase [Alcaligenes faecalis]AYZ90548.1 serine hydrolase [Alcaligenes faecalis]MCX5595173.1 class A beta-lactamase-related serine hydrolase [Alcaligenes faecalis]QQC33631.1 serine hydrolase [Alcaligenes faecalis]CAJ0910522.1 beta-lactamase class A [Alcaligenes faecalis subsp. faecalis]
MFTLGSELLDAPLVRERLQERLEPLLTQESARISMAVYATDGTSLFEWHAQRVMPSASLIKTPMLLCLLEQVAQGKLSLDTVYPLPEGDRTPGTGILSQLPGVLSLSLRELALLMIILSDNVATNALIDLLGMDNINAWSAQAGLQHTDLQRHMMDMKAREAGKDNWTTAQDACSTLLYLLHSPALPENLRQQGLDMLADQRERGHFAAILPSIAQLAHKTGSLPGLRHDAGILTMGERSVVLAVMADGFTDGRTSTSLYGGQGAGVLSRLALETARALQY